MVTYEHQNSKKSHKSGLYFEGEKYHNFQMQIILSFSNIHKQIIV